jgi:DNA-binding transcriptional ArsR family regulator
MLLATETKELDAIFSALASATRRSLITQLGEGDATVSELAEPFDMTLAAVSKHLSVLEKAGLVRRERQGKARRCSLQDGVLENAEVWLASRREHWEATLSTFADYVESTEPETP